MCKALGQAGFRWGEVIPDHKRDHGQTEYHWHKHSTDPIRETLDRRLGALRLLHETDNLMEDRIGSDFGRTKLKRTGRVERCTDDRVANLLEHRHRLTS